MFTQNTLHRYILDIEHILTINNEDSSFVSLGDWEGSLTIELH